jgi:thiosulfate reductase cytochrome b subunit
MTATPRVRHRLWVRLCHWTLAVAVGTLAVSGAVILAAHPRLYWGEVGNDLTPALLTLPINDNHRPEGWVNRSSFAAVSGAPITADRGYEIFNQNGWARSLHFLAGWFFVLAGAFYAVAGFVGGHARRDLLPRLRELGPRALARDLAAHLRGPPPVAPGPPYGLLQRCAYAGVAFVVLPLMVLLGLSMAPVVTASFPALLDVFGGYQSARTLHFVGFVALLLFLIVHVAMVIRTGFVRQLRAMILGR